MLGALASLALRHPRRMLLVALAVFAVAGVFGATATGLLNARNPFSDPNSASARAEALIEQATGKESSPGVLALVSAPPGSPAVASAAQEIARVPGVATVTAPAPGHLAGLVSADGRSSLVVATLRAAPDPNTVVSGIQTALRGRTDVLPGGADVAGQQLGKQAQADLGLAEAIAFPLLAILALLIFRGVAALLPIAVGGTAVLGTFLVLRLINMALPLSIFALNLVIGLGLGLAVDYSLFLVWRFRDEMRQDPSTERALRVTLATTGRTVVFSAVTVAAALAALTVFPQRFLVSMGLGGVVVALVAAASALLIVPSLLVLLSRRISRARPPKPAGGWYRLASGVMRHPVLVAAGTAALLLVVASPALAVRWSGIDATVLPASQSGRVVSDTIARQFPRPAMRTRSSSWPRRPPQRSRRWPATPDAWPGCPA
ncbi:MAG: MMPL family transporter [Streptosporangiaceae bacterium]